MQEVLISVSKYDDSVYEPIHLTHPTKHLHNVTIVYLSPFSHTHRAFPYTAFLIQTCILFVLTWHNTNWTQCVVWDSLAGQCKSYSLHACDTVQFSILSPEFWNTLKTVERCTFQMLVPKIWQKCNSLPKSLIWGCMSGKDINSYFTNLGNYDQYTHLHRQKQPALLTRNWTG